MRKAVQRATAETRASGVPTKTRLLDAAAELFGARGYYGTQVNDITERARTGIGTFYRYFADKEDILRTLLKQFFERIRGQQVALRTGLERRTPLEQVAVVRETYRVILTELAGRPDVTVTIFRFGYGVSARINNEIWGFVSTMTRDIVGDLTRAESAGLIAVDYKDLLAHCVAGTVLQVAHKLVADGDATLEAAIDTCTRFTLGGLSAFVTDAYFATMTPILRTLVAPQRESGRDAGAGRATTRSAKRGSRATSARRRRSGSGER
jgi:AcrR family transcriptional regulator